MSESCSTCDIDNIDSKIHLCTFCNMTREPLRRHIRDLQQQLKEAQEKIEKMKNYMNCNNYKCRSLVCNLVDPASVCPCENWEAKT